MWTLKDEHKGQSKAELAKELKNQLLNLKNTISQIRSIEVGINGINHDKNHDIVLITEFDSFENLAIYAKHPAHVEVGNFVASISTARSAVDFTVD